MKLKNRNGSTLALTLIVFAVLMILATFILGFMVTENKQAMYHQNKTQAYYIARSGAEVVEKAIVDQLLTYEDDANEISTFLEKYNSAHNINFDIIDENDVSVSIKYGKLNSNSKHNVLIIESTGEFNNIKQKVKKAIFSTENIVSSENKQVTFSGDGQFMIYLDKAIQHDNKGEINIPDNYARPATQEEKDNFLAQEYVSFEWDVTEADEIKLDGNIIITDSLSEGTYGSDEEVTNIIINGPLTLSSTISFVGEVNIYIRDNLIIKNNARINSEKELKDDYYDYKLNFYVYNYNSNAYGLKTDGRVSDINITGDIFVDKGKAELYFHQNTFIDGNILYNGTDDMVVQTHSNNLNQLSKLLGGSIYAPNAKVKLGDETDKTAFAIDGFIYAKEIHVYVNNNSQAKKFYTASSDSSSTTLPIETKEPVNTRSISYRSFYTD